MKFISLVLSCGLFILAANLKAQAPSTSLTIEYVAVHPELWPKQVITKSASQTTLRTTTGAPVNVMLPAGELMKVAGMDGSNVQLYYQGGQVSVPAAQTDLLAGAASNQIRIAAAARPPAGAPTEAAPNPVGAPAPPSASAGPIQNPLGVFLKDGLVGYRGDAVTPQSGAGLATKKYIALYFATRSDGNCQKFTPRLVQFYGSHRRDAEKFEIVFVPTDHSAKEMAYHVREAQMPWLAVDFDQQNVIGRLRQQFGKSDVPNLVVVDEQGRTVISGYEGNTFVGAEKAMEEFGRLLDRS